MRASAATTDRYCRPAAGCHPMCGRLLQALCRPGSAAAPPRARSPGGQRRPAFWSFVVRAQDSQSARAQTRRRFRSGSSTQTGSSWRGARCRTPPALMSRGITVIALALVAWAAAIVVVSVATPAEDGQHGSPPRAFSSPEARAVAFLAAKLPDGGASMPAIPATTTATPHAPSSPPGARARRRRRAGRHARLAESSRTLGAQRGRRGRRRRQAAGAHPVCRSAGRRGREHGPADRGALADAADLLAADQQPDGSWRLDSIQSLGSPATYGTTPGDRFGAALLVRRSSRSCTTAIARADAGSANSTSRASSMPPP